MSSGDPIVQLPARLDELAALLGARLIGEGAARVSSVATLDSAGAGDLSFLANPAYRAALARSAAGAVIISDDAVDACRGAALVVDDPYASWAKLLEAIAPLPVARPGIHPTAVIDDAAEVDSGAQIDARAIIGAGARVGAGAIVGPACVVDSGVVIGENARLVANVYVGAAARIGCRVILHPGTVVGSDGFGLAMDDGRWRKIPQVGSVRIGDDSEIGANTTIDRGAVDDTVLGRDVRVDNQVQIAHNVRIGDHTAIAGCVGIAGSTVIGRNCMIAGATGIGGHLEICDHVVITAMSTVLDSIDEPGQYGSGIPARPLRAWQRILVRLSQLERLFRPSQR